MYRGKDAVIDFTVANPVQAAKKNVLICTLSGLGYGPNQVIVKIAKNTLGYASSSFLKEQKKIPFFVLLELPGSPGKIFIYPPMSSSLLCSALSAGDWGKRKHFQMLAV